jgi:hypothetical protein
MRQYLVTVGFLAAALAFYAVGFSVGAVSMAVLAVALESAFWIRVLVRRRSTNAIEHH